MWIGMDEKKPTAHDADEYGCVIVWHLFNGAMVTGWRNASDNRFHTHWMPTPAAPEGVKERHQEIEEKILNTSFFDNKK